MFEKTVAFGGKGGKAMVSKGGGRRFWATAGGLCLALLFLAGAVLLLARPPQADLWERWTAHDAGSSEVIDHGILDIVLARYLNAKPGETNLFAYKDMDKADLALLSSYIEKLSKLPIGRYNRGEQMAFFLLLGAALRLAPPPIYSGSRITRPSAGATASRWPGAPERPPRLRPRPRDRPSGGPG